MCVIESNNIEIVRSTADGFPIDAIFHREINESRLTDICSDFGAQFKIRERRLDPADS